MGDRFRPPRQTFRLLVLLGAGACAHRVTTTAAGAAWVPPRLDVRSARDVRTFALSCPVPFDQENAAIPCAALLAMRGDRAIPWILETLEDRQLPLHAWLVGVQALAMTRHPDAVTALLAAVQDPALSAYLHGHLLAILVGQVDPRVCAFWETSLASTDVLTRGNALGGLSYCPGDWEDYFAASRDTADHDGTRLQGAAALEHVRRTDVPRSIGGLFESPPPPDGVYVPAPWVMSAVERLVCGASARTCPSGVVLRPTFLRDRWTHR